MAKRPEIRIPSGVLDGLMDMSLPAVANSNVLIHKVRPLEFQPRRSFDEAELQELANSIRSKGILQPLLVRVAGAGFEIIAGERRWRAAQMAGLTEIPVYVREMSDNEARIAMLMENLQRTNLNAIDEVDAKLSLISLELSLNGSQEAYALLMRMLRHPEDDKVERLDALFTGLGESWQSFAKNKLRLLKWPENVLQAMRQGLGRTTAAIIVSAAEEHHEYLLALALSGATRQQIKDEASKLKVQPPSADPLVSVGRALTSKKWRASLEKAEEDEVAKWLAAMPAALRRQLE